MSQSNNTQIPSGNYDITQINRREYDEKTLSTLIEKQIRKDSLNGNLSNVNLTFGLVVIIIVFTAWILKTEKGFNKRTDERIDSKIRLHTLAKKPNQTKMETEIINTKKCVEMLMKKMDDRSNKTDIVLEKISISMDKQTEAFYKMDVRLARVEENQKRKK